MNGPCVWRPMLIVSAICSIIITVPVAFASDLSIEDQARVEHLFKEVRCPVCAGQSIAESDVEVSKTLRAYIVDEIESGKSDEEIKRDLVAAYGAGILLTPMLSASNFVLWCTPILMLVVVAVGFVRIRRRATDEGGGQC